jgi:hypothetical protein
METLRNFRRARPGPDRAPGAAGLRNCRLQSSF